MSAVNHELLLHVLGMKSKSNSYRKVKVHWQSFLLQFIGLRLPAFQNTQDDTREFIERRYQRHTCALAAICWEHKHLRDYCFSRINI